MPKLVIVVHGMEKWRGVAGQQRVGCKIRRLKFKVFADNHWINGTKITREHVYLHWKYIYLYLKSEADLKVEIQITQ